MWANVNEGYLTSNFNNNGGSIMAFGSVATYVNDLLNRG